MVEASLVASAVLSAAIVLGVIAAVTLSRGRTTSLVRRDAAGSGYLAERQGEGSWAAGTDALFAAFALLTLGAFATVVFYVQGGGFSDPITLLAAAATGLGIALGSYSLGENAGIGSAGALFVTALVLGIILVAVITMNLLTL